MRSREDSALARGDCVKPRVVACVSSFPPAQAAGGPIRSVGSLVRSLSRVVDFRVFTSACDLGSRSPLPGVSPDRWQNYSGSRVYYRGTTTWARISAPFRVLCSSKDVLYLNSLFNAEFTVVQLLTHWLFSPSTAIVIAPRGECSKGAMNLKRTKKQLFLKIFRLIGFDRKVVFHASTMIEATDIAQVFGEHVDVRVARNLRDDLSVASADEGLTDGDSALSVVYLSRIVPIKNLLLLLDAVTIANCDISLTIAGPVEDECYWAECMSRIEQMPGRVSVSIVGHVMSDAVVEFLSGFDLMVLPTMGENFGHVILESLVAGTPVIVGRDTPWGEVEGRGAGFCCDPFDVAALARQIELISGFTREQMRTMRRNARNFADEQLQDSEAVEAHRSLFVDVGKSGNRRTRRLRKSLLVRGTRPTSVSTGRFRR